MDWITKELLDNEDIAPTELGKCYLRLSAWYSHYAQMIKRIQVEKPKQWLHIQQYSTEEGKKVKRDKALSNQQTDVTWEATKMGKHEIALKWELKRIETIMQAISKRLYVSNVEARNQY